MIDSKAAPAIAAAAVEFPSQRHSQDEVISALAAFAGPGFLRFAAASGVQTRHLALPIERYTQLSGFTEANQAYLEVALDIGERALRSALDAAKIRPDELDVIFSTTVTGLAVPTLDARLVGRVGLRSDIKRIPLFGLGCVAGAAGVARMNDYLRAYPDQTGVLLAVELCSLTIQQNDLSVANLVASSLFGDGGAAVIARGAGYQLAGPRVLASRSRLYPDTEGVMGWEIGTDGFRIVLSAEVPTVASSPKPKLDAVVGLVIGLALGLAIAFLVDLLDRRVKAPEEFEALYGLRSLTTIPERGRSPSSQAERTQALEPFRILRNGLNFLSPSSPIKVVLVTSAVPGEGKSTVAAGLARAVALSGRSCVLVEADLRRPTFAQQFDLGGDQRGLTTALVGGASPESLLREAVPGLRSLQVLPSGPLPPNSAELLRSAEMGSVLERLSQQADMVILDAPPLLPVADAQVLLDHPQVDACLVVARVYKTTREEARRTRAVIERLRLHNMGLVVNGIRELDSGYDYYGTEEAPPTTSTETRPPSRLRG